MATASVFSMNVCKVSPECSIIASLAGSFWTNIHSRMASSFFRSPAYMVGSELTLKKTTAGNENTPTSLARTLSSNLTIGTSGKDEKSFKFWIFQFSSIISRSKYNKPAASASSSIFSNSCKTGGHCLQSFSASEIKTGLYKNGYFLKKEKENHGMKTWCF